MSDKSRWQRELDDLPEWARKIVLGLIGSPIHGYGIVPKDLLRHLRDDAPPRMAFRVVMDLERSLEFRDGFDGARALAAALTAPFPPPSPSAVRERRAEEWSGADDLERAEGYGYNQPCIFAYLIEDRSDILCDNHAWPDAPRKCRRNRTDYRHEDCPGFVANPDWNEDS